MYIVDNYSLILYFEVESVISHTKDIMIWMCSRKFRIYCESKKFPQYEEIAFSS